MTIKLNPLTVGQSASSSYASTAALYGTRHPDQAFFFII